MRRKRSTSGRGWRWAVGLACGLAWLLLSVGAAQAQTLETKLLPLVGISSDQFGVSAAVSGDIAVVGSVRGSANIFTRGFGVWTQQARLTSPDSNGVADYFGSSVAVSGDTVVVGAYLNSDHGRYSGSVYIFTRGAFGVWTQQAKLTQADGTNGDQFGYSVAVSGDTLVVGANGDNDRGIFSGSTYVFTRTAGVWTQQAKLTAADGAAGDVFGAAVAVSGDTAVVGAYQDDDRGGDSGSAYVFTRTGGVWSQQAKLTAADGSTGDSFGASVAVSGDTAVVGAYGDDSYGDDGYGGQDFIYDSGSAYAFARTGGAWTQQAKLTPDTDVAGNSFGISVAVSGDTAVIGAYRDDAPGANSGSAYAFTRAGGTWARYSKLTPVDGAAGDSFGVSVAVSGDTAVIGAYGDDDRASESGSAYAILLGVDGDGDGVADSADFCPGTAPGAPVSGAGCALEQSSGTPGPAGPQGAAGSNGLNGVNGFDGAQGPAGPQGPVGEQGPAGAQGPAGPQGLAGTNGVDGAQGAAGANGLNGADGTAGANGADGPAGPQGPIGPAGVNGADGAQGAAGANGLNGADGAPGPRGPAGADGANGLNGANGVDGAAGAPGTNGTEGPVGPQGPSGPAGTSGANGLNGVDGAAGPQGSAGTNGVNGADGAAGANGADGPAGPQGPIGLAGVNGADGAQGPVGPQGPSGPAGANGANGLNGANGAVGPPGPQGPAGTNGLNGTNGVNGAPGSQGAPGGVPSGTVIFLQSAIPAPAGYTLIGSFDQVVHVGHDNNGRDHDDERERRNGRDQVLRLKVYRKN